MQLPPWNPYDGVPVIRLWLGCILKPFFLVLHLKIKLFSMYWSIALDLGKYKAKATARRRRS